jgi:WhiB family redox-sensing transcriptional regulator
MAAVWVDPLAEHEDAEPFDVVLMADESPPPDLAGMLVRPAWHEQAACRGVGADVFHGGRGQGYEEARGICAGCDVTPECLAYALNNEDRNRHGVWGGCSPGERRALAEPVRLSGRLPLPEVE